MSKINEIRIFNDLKRASFDVKSVFTKNVIVSDALDAIEEVVKSIADENLPLPKEDYLKLAELCMNFDCFSFNKEEYFQHSGLAMGSPLRPVAACLFMGILEETHFFKIIGSDSICLWYVDDVLIVVPKDKNLEKKKHGNSWMAYIKEKIHLRSWKRKNGRIFEHVHSQDKFWFQIQGT